MAGSVKLVLNCCVELVLAVTSVELPSTCSMGLVFVKDACEVHGWRMVGVLLDRSVQETSGGEE